MTKPILFNSVTISSIPADNGIDSAVILKKETGTETVVTGLTPAVYYTFSVNAENAVSTQDMSINDRTVSVTILMKEGGINLHAHGCV